MTSTPVNRWLGPIRSFLDPAGALDWVALHAMDARLDAVLSTYPIGPELAAGPERSRRLLAIRIQLSRDYDAADQHQLFPLLTQFLCGYRDQDLRDAIGLGHGTLIARHGSPTARHHWLPRLNAGELAGIAITEPHGGSRPAASRTRAVPGPSGIWLLSGRKTWISRLTEASVFTIFFRAPTGALAAAVVDATTPGLHRTVLPSSGLSGWTWGILDLHDVVVEPADVLVGEGMSLLRAHFARYRPLVTATALGGAAMIFDSVTNILRRRHATGDLPRLRDSTLVTLGRTHPELTTALLGAAAAAHLEARRDQRAEQWSAATKAHGVDTANRAAAELALLMGGAGFVADSPIAKTCRDLRGYQLADGAHESLLITAGRRHILPVNASVPEPRRGSETVVTALEHQPVDSEVR